MNYIALGVIAEIDDIYAGSIKDTKLRDTIENEPEITIKTRDVKKRTRCHKIIRGVYGFFNFFYVSFYFYFMPFATIILSQIAKSYNLK